MPSRSVTWVTTSATGKRPADASPPSWPAAPPRRPSRSSCRGCPSPRGVEGREGHLAPGGAMPTTRGRARAQHVPREADRRRRADRLEGVVDAARRDGQHRRDRIVAAGGGHGVRRPARGRARASPRRAPRRRCARRRPAAPRPRPAARRRRSRRRRRCPRRDPRRVADRAHRGRPRRSPAAPPATAAAPAGTGTAAPAGTTQRSAKQETKLKCCTGRRPGRAGATCRPAACRPTPPARPSRTGSPPGGARRARAAGGDEAERHRSPGATCVDALAHRLHHAGALVAQHDREAPLAEVAVGQVQVGVADAGGGDAHEHLAGAAAGRARARRPRAACGTRAGRRRGSSCRRGAPRARRGRA